MKSRDKSASGSPPARGLVKRLAIHGGQPAFADGPPTWPLDDEEVRAALEAVYADGNWGRYHGPYGRKLIEQLADFHGCEHVMLCCSGTIAVELALRALGVGHGDEVILAGYDFPGNFRCIEAVGAHPVLVDVERDNGNLDPAMLKRAFCPAVKAVIVSHLHGAVVPMDRVMQFAAEHGIGVVEDACQAPGAMIAGRRAGAWGDVGVLSFGGSKLLTAGRGGALLTSRADVFQRAKVFSDRGNQAFPLSELQAAVLIPQLSKLESRNAVRTKNVARLATGWKKTPGLRLFKNAVADSLPAYYKLGLQFDADALGGATREQFILAVRAEGVALDAGFRGFARRSSRRCRHCGDLAQCRRAAASTLVLHHPVLLESAATIDRVAAAVEKVAVAFAALDPSEE